MSSNSVLLTVIRNPFDPHGSKIIKEVRHEEGKKIQEYLLEFYPLLPPETEIKAARNGSVLDDLKIPCLPGDSLVLCPVLRGGGDSKNPLAMLAMVAVMVVAWYAGPALAGGMGLTNAAGALTSAGQLVSGLTSAAVMATGGLVVNAVFPSKVPSLTGAGDYADTSATYSWGSSNNPYEEGGAVPVLYGTMRVTPTIISTYTRTENSNQILTTLYLVAEGPLSSISSVEINDNAYTNYDGVSLSTALGTNGQAALPFFKDSYSDITVYSKLNEDLSWTTTTTAGDAVDALVVILTCPSGLWYANDSGGLSSISVYIEIQSRREIDESSWTDWTSWGTYKISGSQYSTIRKTARKDNLTQGKYEVRARFTSTPPTGIKYGSDVYLDYVQEVYYDDFKYPNTALLGVEALATDQLSGGRPRVSCVAKRSTVTVNGVSKSAANPAWASWDVLTNARYGAGISESDMIESEFQEWADWCDSKNISVGLYLDSTTSLPSSLAILSELGRGRVIQRGTKFGCIVDKPSDPVQMFTVGNIVTNSFEEAFLDMEDRANVISITYWDEDDDYARKSVEVRTSSFNSSNEDLERTVDLVGCTNKRMAVRHATYLLNCNNYLKRTISFKADVDAIACQPGDVILFQHDVPLWGFGGRVVSYDPETFEVVLDREIDLTEASGSYRMVVRHEDDALEEMAVTNGHVTTDRISVSGSWAQTPKEGEIYALGLNATIAKKFRVVSISKTSDLTCKISALEYYDEVYEDEGHIPQDLESSLLTGTANLRGTTTFRLLEGLQKAVLCLSWIGSAIQWKIWKRFAGTDDPWEYLGSTQTPRFDVFNLQNYRYYEFCVSHTGTPSGGKTVITNFPGDAAPVGTEVVKDSYDNVIFTTTGETIYIVGE